MSNYRSRVIISNPHRGQGISTNEWSWFKKKIDHQNYGLSMCFKQDVGTLFLLSQNFGQSLHAEDNSDEDLYFYRKWRFNKLEGFNTLEQNPSNWTPLA